MTATMTTPATMSMRETALAILDEALGVDPASPSCWPHLRRPAR